MKWTVDALRLQFVQVGPHLWSWGDWHIAYIHDKFTVITSSGIEYGPFFTFEEVLEHVSSVAV